MISFRKVTFSAAKNEGIYEKYGEYAEYDTKGKVLKENVNEDMENVYEQYDEDYEAYITNFANNSKPSSERIVQLTLFFTSWSAICLPLVE